MNIDKSTLNHLAALSNLTLSDAEAESLGGDLENIINYISELDALDTDGIEPTFQVFEMENIWRPDEIRPMEAEREALLALTKNEKDHQIKVPKVL